MFTAATSSQLNRFCGRIRRQIVTITALILLLIGRGDICGQSASRRADDQFLRQLTERLLFDLAEQHCRSEFDLASAVDGKSAWQLRLCRTYEHHAWFAESANRGGLLAQSLEESTAFLNENVPSPEEELELRLQQSQTLVESVRISLTIQEAGHLFGESELGYTDDQRTSQMATIDRAIELAESLSQQLEKIRQDLDVVRVRELRDSFRLTLAELYCLKWRLTSGIANDERQLLATTASELLNVTIRAAASDQQRHWARWLLAELSLYSEDAEEFQLRIGSIRRQIPSGDFAASAFLEIRSLLRRQEATAALNLANDTVGHTALQIQQLEWLKLEAMLGVCQLVGQLNEPDLASAATEDFQRQAGRVRKINVGVFLEAAERAVRRYELVDEVGVEVADLVERIDRHRATGKTDGALRLVDLALNRISASASPRARAALLLRSGEILIVRQRWELAARRLEAALELFTQLEMTSQQAVADLLRIFVMAQRWASATDNTVTRDAYVSALELHLQQFPNQATSMRARTWLLQVTEANDPLRGAEIALTIFREESQPLKRIAALTHSGQLMSRIGKPDLPRNERLLLMFREGVRELRSRAGNDLSESLVPLDLLLLEFDIADTPAANGDWAMLDRRLQETGESPAIADAAMEADEPVTINSPQYRWSLLEAVIASRSSSYSGRLSAVRSRLLNMPTTLQEPAIAYLSDQFGGSKINAGDVWLARTVDELVKHMLDSRKQQPDIDLWLRLLPNVVRTATVTGNPALQSRVVHELVSSNLTEQQLDQVAMVMSTASRSAGGNDGKSAASLKEFWHHIIRNNKQGSEFWLEASLRLAEIAAAVDDRPEARRQLGVVTTLYPDWGNDARRVRAEALAERIRE